MLKIAVDAMGGDYAPASEVEGAIEAARDLGVGVILVGRSEQIQAELDKHRKNRALSGTSRSWRSSSIEIVDAQEVITMDDPVAVAVRRKKNSSIRVAAKLVRDGQAQALVSAGNTGAVMMTAKLVIGALPKVDRPALAAVLPTLKDHGTVILDVGANAECKPAHLYDFAVMGSLYSNVVVGVPNPRVGLLSIGEEEIKGNDLTKEAFKLLKNSSLNFVGNVEGRDMYTGQVDVLLKHELQATIQTKAGAMLTRPAFQKFKERLDYAEYGGAPLLGIKGVAVICHGRSNAKAIRSAIAVARTYCLGEVNGRIEAQLGAAIVASHDGHR
ncbi:MAG: phosphate acyltransferase PlsX [Acidobacteria bacterium]|nr:MAG: phosphate acyltransferase PlsX [Acidobacteriota bacterium]